MSSRRFDFGLLVAWLCLQLPAQAGTGTTPQYGQTIKGSSGDVFMQEVLPPPTKQALPGQNQGGPEVTGGRRHRDGQDLPLDFSNLGVKLDPAGNIIPLLNNRSPDTVQPLYSTTTITREIPYVYSYYPYGAPYAYFPPGYAAPYYRVPAQGFKLGLYVGRSSRLNLGFQGGGFPGSPGFYAGMTPRYPAWQPPPSPSFWAAPRGGYLWLPGVTEFESTSTIRPLFTSPSVP